MKFFLSHFVNVMLSDFDENIERNFIIRVGEKCILNYYGKYFYSSLSKQKRLKSKINF